MSKSAHEELKEWANCDYDSPEHPTKLVLRAIAEHEAVEMELKIRNKSYNEALAKLRDNEELLRGAHTLSVERAEICDQLQAKLTAANERVKDLEHESEMWDQHMGEFTDYEGDEAPWITIQREFRELKAKLTAYEKQWTDMHETICKFQGENTALKAALDSSERREALDLCKKLEEK